MIKNSLKQKGSAHVIIIVILVIALLGVLGFVFWQNFAAKESKNDSAKKTETKQQDSATPKADSYSGWQSYKSTVGGYDLRYPKGWTVEEAGKGELTSAFASASFAPTNSDSGVITVSNFQSDLNPKAFVESNSTPQVIDSSENPINGNSAYYHKDGDGTYINRSYVISHAGTITTISMTEMLQNPKIDNSMYVSQFNLLAESIRF